MSLRKVAAAAAHAAEAIARVTNPSAARPTPTAKQLADVVRRNQAPELLEALREKL